MPLMGTLRQSTSVNVKIGPFVDNSDGFTPETGLTIAQSDVLLSKNGGTLAAKNDASSATHDALGYYTCPLDATDLNTVGLLTLSVSVTGSALPVRHDYQVVEEVTYDLLYASGATPVDDIADQVWDESNAAHNTNNTMGRLLNYTFSGTVATFGAVSDVSPAASGFDTNLTAADNFYNDQVLVFITGSLVGQARPITSYANTNGAITFDEPFTSAPGNGDVFVIRSNHIHPVSQISAQVLADLKNQDRRGTAQGAGSGSNTLVLAAGDAEADDFYNEALIILLEGTGTSGLTPAERTRRITDYVNGTNQITVDANWASAPASDTVYLIVGG